MKTLYLYIFFAIIFPISATEIKDGIFLSCDSVSSDTKTLPRRLLTSEEKKLEEIYNRNALNFKQKLTNAKNSFKFKVTNFNKSKYNIFESVFVIKDKISSGSGFYTSLWGVPVGLLMLML